MKRRLFFLFGWLLLAIPTAVQAQFTLATNNGAITIVAYTNTGPIVAIPAVTNGLPVTAIAPSAFLENSTITTVNIGANVASIGTEAFAKRTRAE